MDKREVFEYGCGGELRKCALNDFENFANRVILFRVCSSISRGEFFVVSNEYEVETAWKC